MINLYIINEFGRGSGGGIKTYVRELPAVLRCSEVNVCVVHLRFAKLEDEPEESNGVRHLYIPAPDNWNKSVNHSGLYYRNVVYLLRLLIKNTEQPVFHLNYNSSGKLAKELKKAFDCKVVSTVHYFNWCFDLLGNVSRFKQILATPENKKDAFKKSIIKSYSEDRELLENVDHIICLSERTRHILQDDYQILPDKITVIYNGLSDYTAVQNTWKKPDVPVLLFVGKLDDVKGLTYTLRAFKKVLNSGQACRFIIAGSGAFDTYMEECEDIWVHITWTGQIGKEKLYGLYSIADIGVMPSFHEQCSYAAIEMMMFGLPLIASTTTGLREMVEDGVNGLLIPVIEHPESVEIDTDLFAEKILYLLQHPAVAERMGQNGRKKYLKEYSAEVFRENMLQCYTIDVLKYD